MFIANSIKQSCMRKIAFILCFSSLLSLNYLSAQSTKAQKTMTEKIEQQLMQLERDWSAAYLKHDTAMVARIIADEYVGIDGRGIITNKTDEMEEAAMPAPGAPAPPFTVVDETVTDMKVRVYGTTAVINGRVIEKINLKGKDQEIQYRRTTVWVKQKGQWKCVSFHGSRIVQPG
jgi:ketosteroid isomerase-like protein